MDAAELLLWARGPGLLLAVGIFLFGMLLKLAEILLLGRERNLAPVRASGVGAGFRTLFRRSFAMDRSSLKTSLFVHLAGYAFHVGLLAAIFLYTPHVQLFGALTGLTWPALPSPVVDLLTVIALVSLMALLWHRLTTPVLRLISTGQDYLAWALSFFPLLTGYMAYHHLWFDYDWLLAIHILSAELLLVFFPFTKLSHAVTLFMARWYNGMMAGQRGVQS